MTINLIVGTQVCIRIRVLSTVYLQSKLKKTAIKLLNLGLKFVHGEEF